VMADTVGSTKPYMIRAIHEWCEDNGLTPYLLVVVNAQTIVPKAFVKNGEIVLNLSYSATKDLHIDNEAIIFFARFSGAAQNLYVPIDAVRGIFARENGQGMFFEQGLENAPSAENDKKAVDVAELAADKPAKKAPNLTVVK
jgi:stringent starvation protein B